ncbi:unnamed protein product, partial [Mesorhabditis spiculigera]
MHIRRLQRQHDFGKAPPLRDRSASLPSIEFGRRKESGEPQFPFKENIPKMMTAARAAGFRYKKREIAKTQAQAKTRKRANSVLTLTNGTHITGSRDSPSSRTRNYYRKSMCSSAASLCQHSLAVPEGPIRKRSGSVPALKLLTLATAWNLKTEHVRALKATWARLCEPPRSNCKGIVALIERVWEKLDSKDKAIKEIFYKAAFVDSMADRCERRTSNGRSDSIGKGRMRIATLRDHTHFFVSLVSQTVAQLEHDPQMIFEHIDKIGRRHAYLKQYGFMNKHWEKIGEYFIDIVVIQDCVRGFPDACRAWTLMIAALIDRLRAAPRRGSQASAIPSTNTSACNSTNVSPMSSHLRIYGSGIIQNGSPDGDHRCPSGLSPRNSCIELKDVEKALNEVAAGSSSPALA